MGKQSQPTLISTFNQKSTVSKQMTVQTSTKIPTQIKVISNDTRSFTSTNYLFHRLTQPISCSYCRLEQCRWPSPIYHFQCCGMWNHCHWSSNMSHLWESVLASRTENTITYQNCCSGKHFRLVANECHSYCPKYRVSSLPYSRTFAWNVPDCWYLSQLPCMGYSCCHYQCWRMRCSCRTWFQWED